MFYALSTTLLAAALAAVGRTHAAAYRQTQNCGPENFLSCFNFFTGADPTNGFVDYIGEAQAQSTGLFKTTDSSVIMAADAQHVYPVGGPGRPSLRLESTFTHTHALYLLNVSHMPVGCGTWPAFWSLGPDWPNGGEIDIIEGVNNAAANLVSLHTAESCSVAGAGETGTLLTSDCAVAHSTTGCGVRAAPGSASYGAPFNAAGGGVYAMEWTAAHIRTWFFPHAAVPPSVARGAPDPAAFGTPQASFAGACDIDRRFYDHRVIFDLTFCGDYAGATFGAAGCPAPAGMPAKDACNAFVADNPAAFRDAYWDIQGLQVFTAGAAAAAAQDQSAAPASSVVPAAQTAPAPVETASIAMGSPSAAPAAAGPAAPSAPAAAAAPVPAPAAAPAPSSAAPAAAAPAAGVPAAAVASDGVPAASAQSAAPPAPTTLATSASTRLVEADLVGTDAAGDAEQLSSQTLITETMDEGPWRRRRRRRGWRGAA